MKRKRLIIVLLVALFLAMTPLLGLAKTVTGTVTSVESGSGGVGTVITLNLGSRDGLRNGMLGWVSKGGESFAYAYVITSSGSLSSAKVTSNSSNYLKVTTGLAISFKAKKPQKNTSPPPSNRKPGTSSAGCEVLENYAYGNLKGSGDSCKWVIHTFVNTIKLEVSYPKGSVDFWVKVVGMDGRKVLGAYDLDSLKEGLYLMGGHDFYVTIYSKKGSGHWSAVW